MIRSLPDSLWILKILSIFRVTILAHFRLNTKLQLKHLCCDCIVCFSNSSKCQNFITMENHNGGVKTRQQLADEYGVCRKTLIKLLRKKRVRLEKGLISPKDQQVIYDRLGIPNSLQKIPIFPKNYF